MSTFTELKTTQPVDPLPTTESTSEIPTSDPPSTFSRFTPYIPSLEALKTNLQTIWSRSRPLSEFLNTSQMSKPELADLMPRLRENFTYYAFNYLLILLLLSAFTVITSPLAFLGGIFVFVAYMYLFVFNPDPIEIGGGVRVDNNVKAVVIMVFSLIVLWLTGAGATFTSLVAVVGVLATAHASLRRPQGEADFETAYTPATV